MARTAEPTKTQVQHFVLIKQPDFLAGGGHLSALEAARQLLDAGMWPLWSRTPCKNLVREGDRVAIYLSGTRNQCVVATAAVQFKQPWSPPFARRYPLALSGTPCQVLVLEGVTWLRKPILVRRRAARLSFMDTPKWGANFMGGMRRLSQEDFEAMTSPDVADMEGPDRAAR
ncbi:hypothetical protein C7S18_23565 (plasmid) [Ahniella affigens]|uniref:EVE domain-containing protein n=1 Tax=Ahniella affigens TaxID=2021234 RepID=A0A2P1PZK8_9GAMM|nr:hypothetical protein [Ahniella affigens]AVQ00278.1 hypothetical protein C7S18_23565 [Ahniella affigens]